MNRRLIHGDIIAEPADALIYSTNPGLTLTGGVGAALVSRFGIEIQLELHRAASGTGQETAEIGQVFETTIDQAPWKVVFHTIATDEFYRTEGPAVSDILGECFRRCVERGDIQTIVCSALGTGYGDLSPERYLAIADHVTRKFDCSAISTFTIVEHDPAQHAAMAEAARKLHGWSVV